MQRCGQKHGRRSGAGKLNKLRGPEILRDAPDCQDGFACVASLGCLDEVLVRGLAEELGATVVRHPGHGDERTE